VEYYTFFDFHGTRAAGGASQLIGVIKAFAAAGVANRIVAILDNDTAAHEAKRALRDVRLPGHMVVLHYPPRDWLVAYPTVGPSGEADLDINGRAANLEMYLGRDVLTSGGLLERVQWAGYSPAMQAYQGELVNKGEVITRWHAKADQALADPRSLVVENWEDLRVIWQHIFAAFSDH
jgi:hypothetical protein